MNERFVRSASNGIIAILCFLLYTWVFADWGKLISSLKELNIGSDAGKAILEIAFGIITAPALGLIISSIGVGIFRLARGLKIDYLEAIQHKDAYISTMNHNFRGNFSITDIDKKKLGFYTKWLQKRQTNEDLFICHEILLREGKKDEDNKEIISFSQRRYDRYFTYLNTASAILISFIIFMMVNNPQSWTTNFGKIKFIFPLVLYIIIGGISAFKHFRQANEFEKRYIIRVYRPTAIPDTNNSV